MNALENFYRIPLSEGEQKEFLEKPHSQLLGEAFTVLTNELNTNGNSEMFHLLITQYSLKLLKYWGSKVNLYLQAETEGEEMEVIEADGPLGEVIIIKRFTEREEDVVTISLGETREVDGVTIKTKVTSDLEEPADLEYALAFGSNLLVAGLPRISSFTKRRAHIDPEYKAPFVYETRTIDCTDPYATPNPPKE